MGRERRRESERERERELSLRQVTALTPGLEAPSPDGRSPDLMSQCSLVISDRQNMEHWFCLCRHADSCDLDMALPTE